MSDERPNGSLPPSRRPSSDGSQKASANVPADNHSDASDSSKSAAGNPRSAARIAAVQALYQMDLAGTQVETVIAEFRSTRFQAAEADDPICGADGYFFAELLRGVVRRQRDIDPMIDDKLATGWRLGRIDSTLRAILRSGAFELVERVEVPARVVITEYLNIAHAFFDGDEPKVVNGVLDRLTRDVRAGEFSKPSSKSGGG